MMPKFNFNENSCFFSVSINKISSFLIVLALMPTLVVAKEQKNICNLNPTDPLAVSQLMEQGKYKGQCLDNSKKRFLIIADQTNDTLTLLNFRKAGKFYKAVIPTNEFENIEYVIVDLNGQSVAKALGVKVIHTELKIKMRDSKPILLFDQNDALKQNPISTSSEFIISFNYMAPKGVDYNPIKGLDSTLYSSVLQFFDIEDEIKTRFESNFKNVYTWSFSEDNAKIKKIVTTAAEKSQVYQYSEKYDTWSNNCTTQLFDIIDEALNLQLKYDPYRFNVLTFRDTGFYMGIRSLAVRGLVVKDAKLELLNSKYHKPLFPSSGNNYLSPWIGKELRDFSRFLSNLNQI